MMSPEFSPEFKVSPKLRISSAIFLFFVFWVCAVCSFAQASGTANEALLPAPGFLDGWSLEGKVETYSRENLYQLIDGEAEMYLPYGFETLTAAYYGTGSGTTAKTSLSVEIFKMGSLLDAFGIYSNYRDPDAEAIQIGADGFVSESQLMFYQDRYFVRLSSSSSVKPDQKTFTAYAEAISKKLPPPPVTPKELSLIQAPDIFPRTEKYVAESLLGYKFFPHGFTAEAKLGGKPMKVFVVITESDAAASETLHLYFEYLEKEGSTPQIQETNGKTLTTQDPLYKGVVMRQSGRYLMGIAKIEDLKKGVFLLDRWAVSFPR